MSKSEEILVLANAINTCLEAVEESQLGAVSSKIEEADLSNDPRNIIVNNVALGAFQLILKEKVNGMYVNQRQ